MNRLGLIWIENTGNSTHFDTVIGAEIDLNTEHDRLKCQIKTGGFKHKNFINTGLVGFIKAPDKADDPAELFIIGRKEEEVNIRGMVFQVRQILQNDFYFNLWSLNFLQPHDIEATVVRGHKNITTAVSFSISSLLCICVEIQGQEGLALDLVGLRKPCPEAPSMKPCYCNISASPTDDKTTE